MQCNTSLRVYTGSQALNSAVSDLTNIFFLPQKSPLWDTTGKVRESPNISIVVSEIMEQSARCE
jgi:hypothetical protein